MGYIKERLRHRAGAHALASDSGTNILSMPNLAAPDNEGAKILVGSNVPSIIGKGPIDTNVPVDAGQLIALGGLFRYRNRSRARTKLLAFLRPIIIRSNEQSAHGSSRRPSRRIASSMQPARRLRMIHAAH